MSLLPRSLRPCLRPLILALLILTLASRPGGYGVIAAPGHQSSTQQPTPIPTPTQPILLTDPVPDPHAAGVQWFAPTSHTLRGSFLDYWAKYGGLAQFGYPITEEFTEPNGPDNKPLDVQ